MKLFAKLLRAITRTARRLRPAPARSAYRPERHYMRGTGPKSKQVAPVSSDRTPTTT